MTQVTKHFSEKELHCRCGLCDVKINLFFAAKLEMLREAAGFPMPISSGARCKEHNKKEGGAPDSRHLYGEAVDVAWSSMSGWQKMKLLKLAIEMGFTGMGIGSTILHLDTRPNTATLWTYKEK